MTFSIPLDWTTIGIAGAVTYVGGYIAYCNMKLSRFYKAEALAKKNHYDFRQWTRENKDEYMAGIVFWPIIWPVVLAAWTITAPARLTRPRSA